MPQLIFPDTPSHEVPLEPDSTKMGFRPKVITSKVTLGEPATVVIRESTLGDDLDLKRFFAAQKTQWSFHAVQLRCTFAAGEGETFDRALVTVQLSMRGGISGQEPSAWSLSPLKLAQKIEVTQSDSIGADLKLLKSELGVETKIPMDQLYIVAYNEQCPNPYWRLKAVPGITIEGVERFSMIVRVARDAQAVGQIEVQADIRGKHFGLIPCKAQVPSIPQLSFLL